MPLAGDLVEPSLRAGRRLLIELRLAPERQAKTALLIPEPLNLICLRGLALPLMVQSNVLLRIGLITRLPGIKTRGRCVNTNNNRFLVIQVKYLYPIAWPI